MNSTIFLLSVISLGFLARSRVVILAGLSLLLIKELELNFFLNFFSKKGIEVGLIFLLVAILAPMVLNPVEWEELLNTLKGWKGVIAIIAGLAATQMNSMGLELLNSMPDLIIGIIVGSLIGIILFQGIPVGPLMAAGIAALLVKIFNFLEGTGR